MRLNMYRVQCLYNNIGHNREYKAIIQIKCTQGSSVGVKIKTFFLISLYVDIFKVRVVQSLDP